MHQRLVAFRRSDRTIEDSSKWDNNYIASIDRELEADQ